MPADSVPNSPNWNSVRAMGTPKPVMKMTIGMSAMNVSLVASVRSRTTPLTSPPAALRDRRGMMAVKSVTPMTP